MIKSTDLFGFFGDKCFDGGESNCTDSSNDDDGKGDNTTPIFKQLAHKMTSFLDTVSVPSSLFIPHPIPSSIYKERQMRGIFELILDKDCSRINK